VSTSSPTADFVATGRRLRIDGRRRWFPDLGALLRYRQLLVLLSRRNITVKYRQTALGTVWIFAGPLVSAGLFSFVFGRIAGLPSDGDPYFAFSYAGLVGWNVFSTTLTSASTSLITNSPLISKIYFPRLVLPLATVPSTLLNTVVSLGVMLALLLVYGIGVSLQVLLLPVWLLLAIVLAMGIGLVLAAVAVSYRDVNYVTPAITSLLIYVSPVAYSIDAVPDNLRTLYLLNPLTSIVEGCRWSLLGNASLSMWAIEYTVALALGKLIVGLALFARLESSFADVI
jgi:lipopolysaccharide transport system permease protein